MPVPAGILRLLRHRLLSATLALPALAPLPAVIQVNLAAPLHRFLPVQALGGALDGHERGETAQIYTPANLRWMRSAGLGEVTYRLRTELGVKAWHFSAAGRWSEPRREQGYWTGDATPAGSEGAVSWGYDLPRRGDTVDQANDNGYSRIDDGNSNTFWKSNPYLDSRFTGEPEGAHPQWAMVDLGRSAAVDALRISWGQPYARHVRVQLYVQGADAVAMAPGHWVDFPGGAFGGHAGSQTVRLSPMPVAARFVRVLLTGSSHTAAAGSRDIRDRLGYAIRELYVGTLSVSGRLHDLLRHAPSKLQSGVYTSSTDPWHKAGGLDRGYEQPSFRTVLASGLTRGRPLLVPVPLLYGTPQAAVAELRYLHALGVPLRGVELGEEPDGQLASPEDYGALYIQFARAIRRVFPRLALGGPGYATSLPDWEYWPDARGRRSWTRRFVSYLQARHRMRWLRFFSFEWYPYDEVCSPPGPQLAGASSLLAGVLALQRREGIPSRIPVYVTEYGYSAYAGEDEVGMPGALLDADTVGTLLSSGASAAYMYGYEPNVPIRESPRCDTWGNLALLLARGRARPPRPLAAFWETQMLTRMWAAPRNRIHTLYAASVTPGAEPVHVYALRGPGRRIALLILNLSPGQAYRATVQLGASRRLLPLAGPVQLWQLSSRTYRWRPAGPNGRPEVDRPPLHRTFARPPGAIALPPFSLTVLTAYPARAAAAGSG